MRPAIPPPGPHGGDGTRVAAALGVGPDQVLDLSASLNPLAPPVGPLVARHLPTLDRYPDPGPATVALARAVDVEEGRLVLTNGGSQAIALVAAELGGGAVHEPDFSLYPRGGGPVWRSNPNNPSGRLAASGQRAEVWDEAFYPLATGTWTRGDPDAWVVGSLTKVFACPGLRLGYVLAPSAGRAAAVRARQPAWSVNALAAAVLPDLLARADLGRWARALAGLRGRLVDVLAGHGLSPVPSDANFVLAAGAAGLRDRLARRGVVVRDCASFGLPGHVRVAVPGEAGLERLAGALAVSGRDGGRG